MKAARPGQAGYVGDEPAIASVGERTPDRREISLRWLGGTFLTGLTSTTLMGVALFAALDGKQLLATPPEIASRASDSGEQADTAKASRIVTAAVPTSLTNNERRRMNVSTVTRDGDADVVRMRPFEHLTIALAARHTVEEDYPAFSPLNIFADTGGVESQDEDGSSTSISGLIYGASVETGAAIRTVDFAFQDEGDAETVFEISEFEAEQTVRSMADILTAGTVETASLQFVDLRRFGVESAFDAVTADNAAGARILEQNISVASADTAADDIEYSEDLIEVHDNSSIAAVFDDTGYSGGAPMAEALATLLNTGDLRAGHAIRLGLEQRAQDETGHVVRATVYAGDSHVLTIALNDQEQFVPAPEPVDAGVMALRGERDDAPVVQAAGDRPSIYDAIYRGVMAYDMPQAVAGKIVRMVAADVDFRSRVGAEDSLELFYSLPEEGAEDDAREVLFVRANFGGQSRKFYKFRDPDGSYDYYDEEGRSAQQFLLRNPVPAGRLTSGFGMRRHPILGYSRMHWGVDWAAPRGTPIIAPGNGTVVRAGWNSGYGKQITLRHANGYETSYSHLSNFAKGAGQGARVRQGQVIGYVGSTGLSTGPHLHYEMTVNGKRVNPLRVRLPQGRSLQGEQLEAFTRERDRINALLAIETGTTTEVASADG